MEVADGIRSLDDLSADLVNLGQAGWAAHVQFWRVVLPSISFGAPAYTNSSIVAFVQELFAGIRGRAAESTLYAPATCHGADVSIGGVAGLLPDPGPPLFEASRGDLVRDLVIVTLLGIVVSPVSWSHHYTIALLPFLYLWCKMLRRKVAARCLPCSS